MNLLRQLAGMLALALTLTLALALSPWVGAAVAQESSYVQVEAQPSLDKAMDRARAYAGTFGDVQGFRVRSGWYAIVLGPMTAEAAANRLMALRAAGTIPGDAFLTTAAEMGERFWPVGAAPEVEPAPALQAAPAIESDPAAAEPAAPVEETRDQALAAEAALSPDERADLQSALQWYGFYAGTIDGAIGKGSRKSMAAWQAARGYEPTGVLTTIQRAELVGGWKSDRAEFGFETVTDVESGIEVSLPLGLVEFDSYAPPFATYKAKAGSGLTIRLISEPGDVAALAGLYDALQGLDVMPPDGERALEEASFTIRGKNAEIESLAHARAEKGAVKGYLISWTPALDSRIDRILPVIQASFHPNGAKALDPGLVPLDEAVRRGLIAGLEAKRPLRSQSGLFVSADGAVVTTQNAVAQCGRVTIERETEAEVAAADPMSGLVLLKPRAPIAPPAFAGFAAGLPQKGAQVTAIGWSYGDRLPAPVLNPGLLEDTAGLDGRPGVVRLALTTLPGDAGGPVLDNTGAVIGLLLPGNPGGPALPQGVALAATSGALSSLLAQAEIDPAPGTAVAPASPDALATMGQGMTALVSCWE